MNLRLILAPEELIALTERIVAATTWDALHLEVVERHAGRQAPGVPATSPFVLESTYVEVRGTRYYDQITRHDERDAPPERRLSRVEYFFDGHRSAEVTFQPGQLEQQAQVFVSRDFGREATRGFIQAPLPLRVYYVGLTPLADAAPDATLVGTATVRERPCTVLRFDAVGRAARPQTLVYHIDTTEGIPLRVSAFENPEALARDLPNWRWEATKVDAHAGRPFPVTSTYTTYQVSDREHLDQASARPDVEIQIDVTRIAFDHAVPKQVFWPVYQPGVRVLDSVARRSYRVPGGPAEETKTETGTPIRVEPPGGGWLAGTGIALGLGALLVAFWLRARSR